jgi:NADH-quinone oxidoreductase subunit H
VMNFILKAVVGVTVMMWVRWTLPRLRIDQVMTTCLKYCVPLAAICFVGAMAWKLVEIPFINDLAPYRGRTLADVRETWVLEAEKSEVRSQTSDDLPSHPLTYSATQLPVALEVSP